MMLIHCPIEVLQASLYTPNSVVGNKSVAGSAYSDTPPRYLPTPISNVNNKHDLLGVAVYRDLPGLAASVCIALPSTGLPPPWGILVCMP